MDLAALNETVNDAAGKAQKNEGLSAQSFLISLAVSGSIFIPVVYIFTFLKDINHKLFQPQCLADPDLLPLPKGRTVWVKQLWEFMKDDTELTARLSLDCRFFLRLLRVAVKLFMPIAVIILPILLPVNYTADSIKVGGLDRFSISNIQKEQHIRWWITAFAATLANIHIWRLLLVEFRLVVKTRQNYFHEWFLAQKVATIVVTNIPPGMWNDESLRQIYSAFNGGPVDVILPQQDVCDNKELKLSTLLRDRDTMMRIRPQISRTSIVPSSIRLMAYFRNKGLLECRIRNLQRDIERTKSIALFHFSDLFTAHLLLQARTSSIPLELEAHKTDVETLDPAFYYSKFSKTLRSVSILVTLNVLAVLWAIPISLTGLLSQLVYLDSINSHLHNLSDDQLGAIQGLAPQMAASILMYCFPVVLQFLMKYYIAFERPTLEVLLQRHYFLFLYTQLFIVVSISSGVTTMIPEIANDVQSVPALLAKNLPKSGNYFYSYFLLQTVTQTVLVLLRLPDSLWMCLRRGGEEHTLKEVRWSLLYPVFTNLICIGIIFSIISPLIALIGTIVFGILLITHTYQSIYILGTKEDTAGLLYWEALNQLFVGVYTMDLFLIGLFILQNVLGPMIVAIILLAGSALVQNYVRTKLHPLIKFVSASRNEFGSSRLPVADLLRTVRKRTMFDLLICFWIDEESIIQFSPDLHSTYSTSPGT
ncbi:hypothetical protein BDV37DRAFT_277282 [Aspergillus pseudonomiae]|uniref:DUF221-domain-containing protein n=1 Tax=Aspergillus pseudonomiae TaxID=1506151 RepID=A0A5N7CTD2_9EURO|nr:uncharacterized protein BDV37DRAFT_277282 [Aspergillus pseudonomiae]KAE8396957.1 hypothetical protein BDV37DRAFT_277282 [Aspergillus pseudonomiae]